MKTRILRPVSMLLSVVLWATSISPASAQVIGAASRSGAGVSASAAAGNNSVVPLTLPSSSLSVSPLNSVSAVSFVGTPFASPISAVVPVSAAAQTPDDKPETPAAKKTNPYSPRAIVARLAESFKTGFASGFTPQTPDSGNPEDKADENGKLFDGSEKQKSDDASGPAVQGSEKKGGAHGLGRWTGAKAQKMRENYRLNHDEFGGPNTAPMSLGQRLKYGARWGVIMTGIASIITLVLQPLMSAVAWPTWFSGSALESFGRVELMTNMGPEQIVMALDQSPLGFLLSLPLSVAMEEVSFRLLGFGLTFGAIALARVAAQRLAPVVSALPDAAGMRGLASTFLRLVTGVGRFAFPIAASLSALSFAVAHFAAWGISPYILVLNFAMGLALARTAYKTRGLTAPIVSHLVFNLLVSGGLLLGMMFGPVAMMVYVPLISLVSISYLWHEWRVHNKLKAALGSLGKGASMLMLAGMIFLGAQSALDSGLRGDARTVQSTEQGVPQGPSAVTATNGVTDSAGVAIDTSKMEVLADMVDRLKPSVVRVETPVGTGSGYIVTPEGLFISNAHVVGSYGPGSILKVTLSDGETKLAVKVLAVNHDKDIAILALPMRTDGKPWPFVKLAENAPREGDEVIAMGFPMGQPYTVTRGIVSGLGQRSNMYVNYIQTDASINPGNSGGPLFNRKGEVVGMNTWIITRSGGSQGLGFSIIAPDISAAIMQFAASGNIATAHMGIIVDLSDPVQPSHGVAVEYVRTGSPAAAAGLKRGDIILAVGDRGLPGGGMPGAQALASLLAHAKPGDKGVLTVLRDDKRLELTFTADAKDSENKH